ncbi:MAG: hypothetical protein C4567_18770 [Deltaproteobacteria bacterium]|nr:MAG: hypothetical protein C4567_18770 [Deltaproteobacteria bacterium]
MPKTANPKPKTFLYPTPAHAEADRLLSEAAAARSARVRAEADLAGELERLKALSPFWESLEAVYLEELKREWEAVARLQAFEGKNKWDLFSPTGAVPESIKTELPGGVLFYSLEEYVVKPRKVDVLANLERYGFEEAIRRTAAVDWDALNDKEEWPDEALGIIGTERKTRETFSFELRSAGGTPAPTREGE